MGHFARVRRSAKFKKRPPNLPQYSGYTKLKTIGKMDVIRRKISEAPSTPCENRTLVAAAAAEGDSCEFGSSKYYALCGFGGLMSCGLTHTLVTPLDLVKCRLQVNKEKYKNLGNGFKLTFAEGGASGLFLGWAPTAIGYSMQGICKFGFYEVFKNIYSGMLGEENTFLYRTSLYLAASASAEFFADIALSPMESVKVRIQTSPVGTFPTTLRAGAPKIYAAEGMNGFYKSLPPLWGRQIPYTMMKFACFERTVELLYQHVVPKPRAECSKSEQLVVTFAAGYIAGVFCAIVSHPADTIVSYMNKAQGSGIGDAARALGFKGLGRSGTQDHHDWNTDCSPMVHLRWSQGSAEAAPPSSPRDARVPEGQARCGSAVKTDQNSLHNKFAFVVRTVSIYFEKFMYLNLLLFVT